MVVVSAFPGVVAVPERGGRMSRGTQCASLPEASLWYLNPRESL